MQRLNDSGKLVEDAFSEQQKLDLPGYKVMSKIINFWHCSSDSNYSTGSLVKKQIIITFKSLWENCRRADGKLKFYNSIKTGFFAEDYLRFTQEPFKAVKYLIRLWMSSHRLHIETGRYQNKPVYQRICRCCTDVKNAELLVQLPYPEVHIESEEHILLFCEFSKDAREQAPPHIKSILASRDCSKLFEGHGTSSDLARFIRRILKMHQRKITAGVNSMSI